MTDLRRTLAVHDVIARAFADDRFPPRRGGLGADLRQFVITTVWVTGIERPPRGERWKRVCEILHLDNRRFWWTIEQDAPRYEPDSMHRRQGCQAPMIRREGFCGKSGVVSFRVTNPADGTWELVTYCSRHQEVARQVNEAERRRVRSGLPEPAPNRGGLLPCYFNWSWPDAYATASPGWKPPALGIRADDWPVLAKVADWEPPTLQPKLSLIAGERSAAAPLPEGERAAPSLRLVKADSEPD